MLKNFDKNQNYYKFYKRRNIPVVFIHGVGLDHKMWFPQIRSFRNNSVLVYDLLGHGKTPLNKKNVNFEDFSNQLNNLLNNLNINKINLVGFSFGSLIALKYAKRFKKKVNKLVLISTVYKRNNSEKNNVRERYKKAKKNIPISNSALNRWLSSKFIKLNPKIKKYILNTLDKNKEDHLNFLKSYKLFSYFKDNTKEIEQINTPSLILTGSKDQGSTVKMSKNLSNKLINSHFFKITNAKHLCSIEYSSNVNMIIKKFLRSKNATRI